MRNTAERLREQAIEASQRGRIAEAAALHARAAAQAPDDPSIVNSAAFFFSRHGDARRAIELLRPIVAAVPHASEPLLNLALILTGCGQAGEARALLAEREELFRGEARYWSVRAGAERSLGANRDALESFGKAARLDPGNARVLHGRARMSLETGRPASDQYRAVVAARPGDRDAWLGYAEALDAEDRSAEATALLTSWTAAAPDWVEAFELLAQLRWANGDLDHYTDHYAAAAAACAKPALYASWCRMLARGDRHRHAADIAASAQSAIGANDEIALIEAVNLGMAGADREAQEIFARLTLQSPERLLHEARHRLRMGDPAGAETLAAEVIRQAPDNVTAWALRGIAWRLADDPRHDWLHAQTGLIASLALDIGAGELPALTAFLDGLHDHSPVPVGQSVRSGTQTRGGLFDRHEPEVRRIEQSFVAALDAYRAGLPRRDAEHPLLRHRDSPWRIAGSWSIRLMGKGRHVPHIHPVGLISSAAYFAVPRASDAGDGQAGWLELGRPPADLRLDLEPLVTVEPQVGKSVLFPSTLYHGTRPFAAGKRLSAAIDVNLDRAG